MNSVLSAPGASGNNTANIALAPLGPTNSSFVTGTLVTITNNGNIPVSAFALKLSDTNNNAALQSGTWACFYSDGQLLVNEPLITVEGYGAATVGGPIAVGGTDTYTLVLYADSPNGGCGPTFTGFTGSAYTGFTPYSGSAQALGPNSAAVSLPNGAQGGVMTVTLTLSYQG